MCCLPQNRETFAAGPVSFWDDVFQKLWADAQQHDLTPALSQLSMPALVATGRFDVCVPPDIAYQIYKAIPHSQFVVFDTSGHLPFFEEPEAFAQVLEEFLSAA
jgi:pimeloyl-ACP methyl ester carboxylesterase